MPTMFLLADPHFSHHGTACLFKREDGSSLRPFASIEEQDEMLIQNWNSVVRPEDKVYVLGDVTMREKNLAKIMPRLKGKKTLVRGNHDIGDAKQYLRWFGEIHACRIIDKIILTHIPIHPDCVGRWVGNIHGHLHHRRVMEKIHIGDNDFVLKADPKYLCVSAEHINYTPIPFEEAKSRLLAQLAR